MSSTPPNPSSFELQQDSQGLLLRLSGNWSIHATLPQRPQLNAATGSLRLECSALQTWDSSLAAFLLQLHKQCTALGLDFDASALPDRLQRLLSIATAVPAQTAEPHAPDASLFVQVGLIAQAMWRDLPQASQFLGELAHSFARLLRGTAQIKLRDLFWHIDNAGPRALGIVSLISFLVGTILAYMSAVQLAQFGAQIYIADLVAIGMMREIGALMTGILLAGRTGAAFAAQLGSMQVNEEIDALRTQGISPMDHLVLPRMLALLFVSPLLTLYAGFVGMVAGLCVATLVFNVGFTEYWIETISIMNFTHVGVGLFKGSVYGALIAFAGCLRGLQCGRSAQAVGHATTSAVVTSILLITVFASLLTILFQRLGI